MAQHTFQVGDPAGIGGGELGEHWLFLTVLVVLRHRFFLTLQEAEIPSYPIKDSAHPQTFEEAIASSGCISHTDAEFTSKIRQRPWIYRHCQRLGL